MSAAETADPLLNTFSRSVLVIKFYYTRRLTFLKVQHRENEASAIHKLFGITSSGHNFSAFGVSFPANKSFSFVAHLTGGNDFSLFFFFLQLHFFFSPRYPRELLGDQHDTDKKAVWNVVFTHRRIISLNDFGNRPKHAVSVKKRRTIMFKHLKLNNKSNRHQK